MTLLTQRQVMEMQNELSVKSKQLGDVLSFLAYTMKERLGGKLMVDRAKFMDYAGWGIQVRELGVLGMYQVVPTLPDGTPLDPEDRTKEPILPAQMEPVMPPDIIGDPCDAFWHKDPDRTGLLCPICGSKAIEGENHEA